jgi:hypothetical protein
MATQKVGIDVVVSDNGSAAKTVKSVEALHNKLKEAQKTAQSINVGGTSGSRAVAAKAAPSGSQAAMSEQQYNSLRGTAGVTGASSRDFANQAQGLGGLVRVYATFAANLFAVSAAFNALKNAADTTSMVKGLDQLGAASGRNLGAVSKRVAELTDGAVSLREAMTVTAQATAAGMSSKNLERLTLVAKTASQALGISMPDALSRLSRGVTKLEPELLDELGIFVKVDEAVTSYARSVGKSASALTDFERRHAFAIAAIEQGEKKFSSIQLDANPYSKLLASVSNLGQKVLEVVNTGLGPLIGMLSESPAALGTALAGIAAILLKQAIPALGMYRQNAKKMADEAHERVLRTVEDQRAATADIDKYTATQAELAFQREVATQKKLADLRKTSFNQDIVGKAVGGLVKKNVFEITSEETATLKARSDALINSDDATYKAQGQKLAAHLLKMEALRTDSKNRGDRAIEDTIAKEEKWYSHQEMLQKKLQRLNRSAAVRDVLANTAEASATLGPTTAFKDLRTQVSGLDVSKVTKGFTLLRGSVGIATSAISNFLGFLGPWITVFTLASTVISAVVGALSNTAKESAATSKAFEALESSAENVARTLDNIAKKDPLEQMSIASIQARANAFGDLAENISGATTAALAELSKMSGTDKAVDWVKSLWGSDVQSKLNKQVSSGLAKAFESVEKGPAADNLQKVLKSQLNVDEFDASAIEKALDKLPDAVRRAKIEELTKEFKKAGIEAGAVASKGTELEKGYAESAKKLQDLRNSFLPQDATAKLGTDIISRAGELATALEDPTQSINAMNKAVENSSTLSLFPPETAQKLAALKPQINELTKTFAETGSEITGIDKRIETLNKQKLSVVDPEGGGWLELQYINNELDDLGTKKSQKIKILAEVQSDLTAVSDVFKTAVADQFSYGAKLVSDRLSQEWAKAGATIGNAIAGYLGDTKAGIALRAKYEAAALDGQKQSILTQIELIKSQERVAIALEENTLSQDRKAAKDANNTKELDKLQSRETALTRRRQTLDSPVTQGSTAKLAAQLKEGEAGAKESLGYVTAAEGAFAQLANISAQMGVVSLKQAVDSIKLSKKAEQEQLDRAAENLKLKQEALNIVEAIAGNDSTILITQKQAYAQEQLDYDAKKKLFDLTTQLAVVEELSRKANAKDKNIIQSDIDTLNAKIKATKETNKQAKANLDNKQILEKITAQYSLQVKEEDRLYKQLQLTQSIENDRLSNASSMLEYYKAAGSISEEEYLRSKLVLDNAKAQLDTQSKIDQTRQQAAQEVRDPTRKVEEAQASLKTATDPTQVQALNALIIEQTRLIDETNTSSDKQVSSLIAQLDVRTKINTATTDQAVAMTRVQSVTESLTARFGELGTTIGSAVAALTMYSTGSDAMVQRHAESLKGLTEGSDARKEQEKKNAKERDKFELDSSLKAVSATKKIFKEKTGAYKLLNAMEKAMHTQKMIMFAVENGAELVKTAQAVAASITRMGATSTEAAVDGAAAVVKQGNGDPYTAFARMAAMAAFVSSVLGKSIGGSTPTFTPTAAQKQEVQGTAMSWDTEGKKVQTSRGVFGDADAKSASIANSLERIRETSVDGLSSSNRMVQLLTNIDAGINKGAKSLYGTTGLRSGSMFGTVEGSQSGGGLLGSGLLASKTSRNITDSGLIIEGTFAQLASDTNESVLDFYEQVTVSKKNWYGKTKTWVETQRKEVDTATSEFFQGIFSDATKMFVEVGAKAGISEQTVNSVLQNLDVGKSFASLRGLKGEEFQKELSAIMGKVLDDASSAIFGSFEQYSKFGEGMLETVVRVVDTNDKVNQQLKNVGLNLDSDRLLQNAKDSVENSAGGWFGGIAKSIKRFLIDADPAKAIQEQSYKVTEALANAAGGLENFVSQANFFRENFLTEAEQLAPIAEAVTKDLEGMGLSANTSREDFKNLVGSLDLTTIGGRELYQKLMDLAPSFDRVAKAAEEAKKKVEDEAKSLNTQLLQIFKNTNALRAQELEAISDTNKGLQLQIWFLEDAKNSAAEYVKSLQDAENAIRAAASAVSSAEGKITSIRDQATNAYLSATEKVANAQQAIANISLEASKRMRDFGKSLREFINVQIGSKTAVSGGQFDAAVQGALSGNESDIANVQALAEQAIANARASSRSSAEFNKLQASILGSVSSVATYAESKATLVETTKDPLEEANETLNKALLEQKEALEVAYSTKASLVAGVKDLVKEYADANAELIKATVDRATAEANARDSLKALYNIQTNTKLSFDALGIQNNALITMNNILTDGFSTLDTNLDGKLSSEEFTSGLKDKATDEQIKSFFQLLDVNQNGTIEELELINSGSKTLNDIRIVDLGKASDNIPEAITAGATATSETIAQNLATINNGTLSTISINTSRTIESVNAVATNTASMVNILNSISTNTAATANAVKAGSGSSTSGGNVLSSLAGAVGGVISGAVSTVKKVWKKIFSDERMKQDITPFATLSNGINIYDFNYKSQYQGALGSDRKRGVLAQEVEKDYPSAVSIAANGMKQVDYSKLPVPNEILKFAKGGVFSNSLVNTPTSFNLGLMGEAGPEAIMPLNRDSRGKLGVAAVLPGSNTKEQLEQNRAMITEIRSLREEVSLLRMEARATATSTNKTTRILERVTQNGESLQVTTAV